MSRRTATSHAAPPGASARRGARELFIYYRVHPARAAALREAIAAWHARLLREFAGLQARLLVRDDPSSPLQTWMETYATDPELLPDGVNDALAARIEGDALGFAALIEGPRHLETFRACAW